MGAIGMELTRSRVILNLNADMVDHGQAARIQDSGMTQTWQRIFILVTAVVSVCACVPLRGTRAAPSSTSCVRAAIHQEWPPGLTDKQKHCRATAQIAASCSVPEARLAGILKEVADLFGKGNAEWADLRADWAGVRCARDAQGVPDIDSCCAASEPATR